MYFHYLKQKHVLYRQICVPVDFRGQILIKELLIDNLDGGKGDFLNDRARFNRPHEGHILETIYSCLI